MLDYLATLALVYVAGYAVGWLQSILWLAWQLERARGD